IGLRELSPGLRDQLMVSMRDRALIEARAAGIDPERALKGHWRQMLRFDIVGSALAISVFLMLYYMLVAFLVVYYATVFGYTPAAAAPGLAVWGWIIRIVVTASFAILPAAVPATTTLVDQGPRVQKIVSTYPGQVKVLQTVDKGTLARLKANPNDPAAQVRAL